jgi:hypothetical protein
MFCVKCLLQNIMEHDAAKGLPRLRGLAWLVHAMCLVGALVLLSIPLTLAASEHAVHAYGLAAHLGLTEAPPAGMVRVRVVLVSLLPVGAGLYVLAQLWRLFARYRSGDVLGAGTANVFGRFARSVVALALSQIVARALMSVALTWDNAPGERVLRVSVDWNDFVLLLLGAALVAIARVMARASRVDEENRAFV